MAGIISGSEFSAPMGGYIFESTMDNITAHAGGGQTLATSLTHEINRVTTVATIGDSVMLPPSNNGMSITVINNGANAMQVYGSGTDTVDGVAYATGVSQMTGSTTIYFCTTAGAWTTNGIGEGYAGSFVTNSYTNAITAHAGGGQGSATLLTTVLNRVTTVATSGDSVILPVSVAGMELLVSNNGANSMNIFPATGEKINALSANTAYALAAGSSASIFCCFATQWHTISGS